MRIVIFGLAKSGTTYLLTRLSKALSTQGPVVEVFEPDSMDSDFVLHRRDGRSWKPSDRQIVKILYQIKADRGWTVEEAQSAFGHFDKRIFIVRDPRDRLISAFFYHWYHDHSPDSEMFERAHILTQKKERFPQTVHFWQLLKIRNPQLERWLEAYRHKLAKVGQSVDNLRRDGWFILRYEDLIDNNLESLEKYVGLKLEGDVEVHSSVERVIRTKAYDNWRRWFTEEDVTLLKPIFNDFLASHGYDQTDWRLDHPEALPAKEGSEYMSRLFHKKVIKQSRWDRWMQKLRKLIK